jgi:hypothetical protein
VNVEPAAGALLILLPLAFNAFFFLLARHFDYPDLRRFQAGGVSLKLVWYGFMLTAVLLAPLAVLRGQVLARDDLAVVPTAIVVGVLASVVQFLGLARWPFLVPELARAYAIRRRAMRRGKRLRLRSSRSTATSGSGSSRSPTSPGRYGSSSRD